MDSEGATKQKSARNLANTDNRWINIQQSTFTNWCNERLKGTETRIDNLITDLDDGVRLIVLLEQLAKRPVPRYNKNPRGPFQKLENLESALDFIQRDEGIYLVNIGALDLTDHKRHLILGLVWHLILHYQIFGHRRRDTPTSPTPLTSPASLIALPPAGGKPAREPPGKSANKLLLNWLKATMPEDVPVRNITTDWNDGKKLSALVNIMKPGLCPDYNSLSPSDALPNTKKAMEQAKEEFGVPQVIDPEHLCMDKPDELSCMTYLSYFCSGEDSPGYNNLLEWVRSKIPEYNIENFTDDWRDGRALSALVNAVAEGSLPGHAQLDPKRPVDNVREAMKTANDNLDGLVDNITPEEFAHKKTDALAMMGYIEWYRKAHVKKSEAVSAMGPATTKEQEVEEPKQEVEEPKQKVEEPKQEAEEPKQKVEEPKQAVEEPEVELYSPPMSPPQVELKLDWGDQMDGSQEQLDTDNGPELKENEEEEEEVWESPLVDLGLTNARVAKPAAFTVDCRHAGPGNLSTSIKSPSGNDVPVTMSGEGMHSAEYTPQEVGPHSIVVLYSGHQVNGSPFTAIVRDPSKVVAKGDGLENGTMGEKAEFTVSTEGAGPGKPVVKVTGSKGELSCDVEELYDHNYKYSYVPQSTGPHAISVVFAEEDVPGSPFTSHSLPAVHPDRVVVKDLPKGPLYATRQYSVTVDTRKAGSGEVSGRAESGSSSSSTVECAVEEAESGGGGVYSVKFTPTQSGSLALHLQFAGQEVPTSPLLFTAVDLRDVKLTPPTPGPLGVFVVDQPYSYTVATGDSSGGVALQVTEARTSAIVPTKIRYLGNAEYLATMTCPEVGVYDAVVCYEGEPVHHAHHSLNVCDKPRPDRVVCSGLSHDGHVISLSADTSKAGPGKLTAVAKGETVGEVPVKVIPKTRNAFRVEVGAAKPDLYRVEVRWQGDPVGGSPFTLDTRPNLDGITVEGAGLAHAVAGEKAEFTVSTKGAGPGKPVVKVTGPKGKVPCVVEKLNDHNYKYSYVPQSTGPHAISVVFAEEDVSGSPFTAQVKEAIPVDARKVAADGPHFPQMHRGPVFTDFNVSRAGDGQLSSTCHSNKFGSVPVTVSPPNGGVQRASFDPPGKDLYQQSVLWSGEHVPGSPFLVDLNPPLASEVRVDGPHPCIEGLGPVRTNIDVREAGDGQLTVKTSGERLGPVPTKVDPSGEEGRFRAEFQASQPDTYLQEVKWSGRAVPGSPFRVPVDLGEAMCLQEEIQDVESSYLPDSMADLYDQDETNQYTHSEPPEAIPSYFVGEKLSITADKEGDEPAGPVVAGCRGDTAGEIPVNLVSNPDGSRTAIIDPRVPDLYSVQVTMSGEHVPGSPFKVRYLPPPTDPSKCRLYNLPPSERRLVAHDDIMYSVDASQAGAGGLSIQSEGPSGVKTSTNLQVVPKENQDFKILYTPTKAGLHKHYIYWGKEAIPQSPVEFEVDPRDIPVYPWAKSVALDYEFPGLKAKDVSGHVLYQPSGKKVKSSVDKNKTQPEKMVASFKPLEAGIYEVHLLHHKNRVRGSPFEVRVLEPPRPDSVKVSGLEDAKCYVGDSVPFRADCSGAGTGELQMKVEGPAGEQEPSQLDILDHKDGTYSATFVPATEGNHLLHVKWAGKPVKKSPFKLTAASLPARSSPPKSDPTKCFILPEDVETMSSPYQHSQQVDFRVSTLNAGPGTLNVTSRGPGKADVVITDNKDGIYSVRFNPSSPGRYKLDVTWDEVSIRGSPCDVMVDGGSDGGRWVKSGLDLSNCLFALGKKHHFLANCEELGEGDFAVQVEPATAASVTVQDLGNRTYHVTLVPKQQGEHKVCVLHGNQHILGSPFACQFQQVGDASKCRLLEDAEEQQHEMGEKVSFLVTTEGAGPGVLSASVENIQKKTSAPADVEQTGDTTYRVTFDPGQEESTLSIKYDSAHIIGSPCIVVQES